MCSRAPGSYLRAIALVLAGEAADRLGNPNEACRLHREVAAMLPALKQYARLGNPWNSTSLLVLEFLIDQCGGLPNANRGALLRGEALAREGKWSESAAAYAEALRDPAFQWEFERDLSEKGCLGLHMGTAFVRADDRENHERLCRLIAAAEFGEGSNPTDTEARRFAMLCHLGGPAVAEDLLTEAQHWALFALENPSQDVKYKGSDPL